MKIVLQDKKTHHFFGEAGTWTPDVKAATDFGDSQRAIEFARAHALKEVVVMVAFVKGLYLESVDLAIDPSMPHPVTARASLPMPRQL